MQDCDSTYEEVEIMLLLQERLALKTKQHLMPAVSYQEVF